MSDLIALLKIPVTVLFMTIITEISKKFKSLANIFNERQTRLWAATEARAIGHGGIAILAEVTGLGVKTISRGISEISKPGRKSHETLNFESDRARKPGAGRKLVTEKHPDIMSKLEALVSSSTRGDPESNLLWTSKSLSKLAAELKVQGITVSLPTISDLLETLGFTKQANSKTKEGDSHEDRDAQFRFIDEESRRLHSDGNPVISIDTKKKEMIGDYKNNGTEFQPKGNPIKVNTHDFPDSDLGKVAPYGIFDVFQNNGWVNVGISADTAQFAVHSIRQWWIEMGKARYPNATEIMITADCGGSNGYRNRLWKVELQKLCIEIGVKITVRHYPPGTSKWNKIEHKMFSFITQNWRGRPLLTRQVVVNLIANTSTKTGLKIGAKLDENTYEKGIKIKDEEMNNLNLTRDDFHGEWNYSLGSETS
jgi:Rhodopirellula transposase DDE domain